MIKSEYDCGHLVSLSAETGYSNDLSVECRRFVIQVIESRTKDGLALVHHPPLHTILSNSMVVTIMGRPKICSKFVIQMKESRTQDRLAGPPMGSSSFSISSSCKRFFIQKSTLLLVLIIMVMITWTRASFDIHLHTLGDTFLWMRRGQHEHNGPPEATLQYSNNNEIHCARKTPSSTLR